MPAPIEGPPQELKRRDLVRLCNPWDIGHAVIVGPSWEEDRIGGAALTHTGYTTAPCKEELQRWVEILLWNADDSPNRVCTVRKTFTHGPWLNKTVMALFASGDGVYQTYRADATMQEYDLLVVKNTSCLTTAERAMRMCQILHDVEDILSTWVPDQIQSGKHGAVDDQAVEFIRDDAKLIVKIFMQELIHGEWERGYEEGVASTQPRALKARKSNPKDGGGSGESGLLRMTGFGVV